MIKIQDTRLIDEGWRMKDPYLIVSRTSHCLCTWLSLHRYCSSVVILLVTSSCSLGR